MERNSDNVPSEIAECTSRYFLDYRCTRCSYAWSDADESADDSDCPNCSAQQLHPVSVVTLTRSRS